MNNETPICDFGLHAGEPYTRLPVSFLNWMIEVDHVKASYARNELSRRENAVFSSYEINKNTTY
jgi:hypothetical protein